LFFRFSRVSGQICERTDATPYSLVVRFWRTEVNRRSKHREPDRFYQYPKNTRSQTTPIRTCKKPPLQCYQLGSPVGAISYRLINSIRIQKNSSKNSSKLIAPSQQPTKYLFSNTLLLRGRSSRRGRARRLRRTLGL